LAFEYKFRLLSSERTNLYAPRREFSLLIYLFHNILYPEVTMVQTKTETTV